MEQADENWLLMKINESIEKNGKADETCLKLIYTQINYYNEFLELLSEFKNEPSVVSYLFIKDNKQCMELLKKFQNKQKVKDYLYIVNQIKMVNEIIDSVRNDGLCHHILVNDGINYRCVRCGVIVNSDLECKQYSITDCFDYAEARILYESVINKNELSNVDDIINEMILMRNERKVKTKCYYL